MNRAVRFAPYALASVAVGYGLFLLFVGQAWMVYTESPSGGTEVGREFQPVIAGLFPVVGGTAVVIGLFLGMKIVSWLGWMVLAVFAGLFMFGVGGMLLPVVALLFVVLFKDRENDRDSGVPRHWPTFRQS